MKKHKINNLNNFIAGWYINKTVCDNLINYFENSNSKISGLVGNKQINKSIKDSTDLSVNIFEDNIIIKNYLLELINVINEYKKLYVYSDIIHDNWGITENLNIQRYYPNQGFHQYHTEKSNINSSLRHLSFMTYLNDIKDAGETEFFYQKIKVKPEKGLTLIWGTDWTFTHRGVPSKTETKYIATGWYSYINK
jgi:hypothetical protein